jgi:type II secretory pathway pseudopilin PulG
MVLVIVIIGIVAAIAVPRLSRAGEGADATMAAKSLAVMQKAVDLYSAEHGRFPDAKFVAEQLTQFTDADGNVALAPSARFTFGPYLRSVPALRSAGGAGSNLIGSPGQANAAWAYDGYWGTITANAPAPPTTPAVAVATTGGTGSMASDSTEAATTTTAATNTTVGGAVDTASSTEKTVTRELGL